MYADVNEVGLAIAHYLKRVALWGIFCVLFALYLSTTVPAQLLTARDQPLPSFEVATIRPSAPDDQRGESIQVAPMRFRIQNATVSELIQFAYDIVSDKQLLNEPRWASVEKFDVDAKIDDAEATATKKLQPSQQMNRYKLMLQSLLKERLSLKVHAQTEQLFLYALEAAKGGPKLTPTSTPQDLPNLSGWSRGSVVGHAVTMSLFSQGLSGRDDVGGHIVVDSTGLDGNYDFTLRWTPTASLGVTSREDIDAPLSTALREQLGLKLTARRLPTRVLKIDQVEHPSAN